MKKIIFIFAISLLCWQLKAVSVTPEEAKRVASRFLSEKGIPYNSKNDAIRLVNCEKSNGHIPVYYLFKIEPKGFVIISASSFTHPVLAYSLEEDFVENPAVEAMLESYKFEILKAEKEKAISRKGAEEKWKYYLEESFIPKSAKGRSVKPLLTTLWDQSRYYNTYCPWDVNAGPSYDYRVPNGCVALAMAQIMNYYRHPVKGTGGVSYIPYPYPRQTASFADHTYNYDAMGNRLNEYTGEVAKLIHHAGISTRMVYTPDGSGANTVEAVQKMVEHFKYSNDARCIYKDEFPDTLVVFFIKVLMDELDQKRPVLYSGDPPTGGSGHAYILDGYDEDSLFHINWGWGGQANGYFRIDMDGYYTENATAFINLYPAEGTEAAPQPKTRLTASSGVVSSGSFYKPYTTPQSRSWVVAAPHASSYSILFDRLDLNPDVDFVTIYKGPTMEDGILQKFTGNNPPLTTLTVEADSFLIVFDAIGAKENTTYAGFQLSYSASLPQRFCSGETKLNNEVHAFISDRSPDGETYMPKTTCSWLVQPTFVNGYSFAFKKFDLKAGDFVDIYDATRTPQRLWKRFDIYNLPEEVYTCNFSKMRIQFVSDNWLEGEGFELEFYAILGVEENSRLTSLNLYPNPATDHIRLDFDSDKAETVQCKILDVTGRLISNQIFRHNGGTFSEIIPLRALAKGLYIMHIETPEGKAIRKFTVN